MITSILTLGIDAAIANKVAARATALQAQVSGLSSKTAREIAANALKLESLGPQFARLSVALEKMETALQVVQTTAGTAALIKDIADEMEVYAEQYEGSFSSTTSFAIEQKINTVFGGPFGAKGQKAMYIKREWAKYQLLAVLESERWRLTKEILDNASSSFDFLGLKAVVQAFAHPSCTSATSNPFPSDIRLLY